MFYTISRAFVSCLGCQHFISDWLGKLKPNKLSTGCQNELKGAAVEKATNPGRRFLFFSRLRCSCARLDKTAMLRRLGYRKHQQHNCKPQELTARTKFIFNNLRLSEAKVRFAQSKFSLCPTTAARKKRGKTCQVQTKFQGDELMNATFM